MWLLPTRNRPQAMKAVIASMYTTGDVPVVAVMVDGNSYDIEWPNHWHIHQTDEHLEMGGALNRLLSLHPNEPFYGILADQSRPQTPNWSKRLVEESAGKFITMCNTTKHRINPRTGLRRMTTICVPGHIVRAIGWIWLDCVVHLYGDDAWEDIGYGLDIIKYLDDVVILALLKRDGEVPVDENHARIWKGKPYMKTDGIAYMDWKFHVEPKLLERLRCL